MEITIVFDDGGSYCCDNIDVMELQHVRPADIMLVMFNGLTVRFNHDERPKLHRMRTHQLTNGEIIARYYCLLTNERKLFFFHDGTFVSMPEGGEQDAHWRTFVRLPMGEMTDLNKSFLDEEVKPTKAE